MDFLTDHPTTKFHNTKKMIESTIHIELSRMVSISKALRFLLSFLLTTSLPYCTHPNDLGAEVLITSTDNTDVIITRADQAGMASAAKAKPAKPAGTIDLEDGEVEIEKDKEVAGEEDTTFV